ncbi:DDE-type integrase/transposase/recombinase [Streptomyces sp. TE5632]
MRVVAEVRGDHPTGTAALQSVAEKLYIGSRETLRNRVKQQEIDAGQPPGTTTEESVQLKAMKQENAALKRANEIRSPEDLARAEPAGARGGPLHRRAPDARARHPGHGARQKRHHHDPGGQVQRAPDPVDRVFVAVAPNRCRAADFTHVKTWSATICVAFVVDTSSRRTVGWSAATVKETVFVLDAPEMAVRQRHRDQQPVEPGKLIHHSDAGSQIHIVRACRAPRCRRHRGEHRIRR